MTKANNAVPNSRKINGKTLSGDVSLSAGDVGAFPDFRGYVSNNSKFSDIRESGVYGVAIDNPNSVADLPAYNGSKLYAYGFLSVFKSNDQRIHQTYYSHIGDIATRQTWDGPERYKPWTTQYSTANKPTAEDVGAYFKAETDYRISLALLGKQYIHDLTIQSAAWVKIAEVTMRVVSTININIAGGSGYNVGSFPQCALTNIVLRTGNDSPHGINAVMYRTNDGAPTDLATVNTSGDDYDIYIKIGPFAQNIILNAFTSANATINQLLKIVELSEVPKDAVKGKVYSYLLSGAGGDVYPVGAPIPWSLPNPPAGYLMCNGQAFNKSQYPQLAIAYPSGVLPDLRGEFIRGWDDERGVDPGRTVLSWQADEFKSHAHTGVFTSPLERESHGRGGWGAINTDGTTSLVGGNETRPRNIAFNYIVRAA
ncbi:tail fiber protein [Photorhabdus tasmaniensis]